jgi:CheY-like chemotaxis protein
MNTKKVLVVDDQPSQLKLMRQMLETLGYAAVTVDSAEEAEHILSFGENFYLIITDLKMPWLNGLKFCRKMKNLNPDLKIYALSGCLYNYEPKDLEKAGFDGIYQKPLSKALLIKILSDGVE